MPGVFDRIVIGMKVLGLAFFMANMILMAFIARLLPSTRKKMVVRASAAVAGSGIPGEDVANSVINLSFMKTIWRAKYDDILKEAKLWGVAPNPKVISLDGETTHALMDFQHGERPLVVYFGSCT